jgi:Fe-S-cluster-containing dehydrogenase component
MNRKKFIKILGKSAIIIVTGNFFSTILKGSSTSAVKAYNYVMRYAMGIQIDKCIGCANCVDEVIVECNEGGAGKFSTDLEEKDMLRSFFVPKLCNHCENPPCAQVCPVGATFKTDEGIVLVDDDRCIGCSYCVQACPYGARYMHPEKKTADKCTLCYHRIKKGLLPACVEVCPTQARVFGDLESKASPLIRLKRMNKIHVLKPELNTEPKVFYTDLDGEVK